MRKTNFVTKEQAAFMDYTANNLPDSKQLTISDIDTMLRTISKNGTTCIKLIERKSKMAEPNFAQRINLNLLNIALKKMDGVEVVIEGIKMKIEYHGCHLLQVNNNTIFDSSEIYYDKKLVKDMEALNFELGFGCCSGCFD